MDGLQIPCANHDVCQVRYTQHIARYNNGMEAIHYCRLLQLLQNVTWLAVGGETTSMQMQHWLLTKLPANAISQPKHQLLYSATL